MTLPGQNKGPQVSENQKERSYEADKKDKVSDRIFEASLVCELLCLFLFIKIFIGSKACQSI